MRLASLALWIGGDRKLLAYTAFAQIRDRFLLWSLMQGHMTGEQESTYTILFGGPGYMRENYLVLLKLFLKVL